MSKIKKITAVFLSAVMLVCTLAVSASAKSIADTKNVAKANGSYSINLKNSGSTVDYKIESKGNYELKIGISGKVADFNVYLYDSDGNNVKAKSDITKTGSCSRTDQYSSCTWNTTFEKFVTTLVYKVSKGTYYIRFERTASNGGNKLTFKPVFSKAVTETAEKPIVFMSMTLKIGEKITLHTFQEVTPGDFKINEKSTKWTSSDPDIVYVNKSGTIMAKSTGKADKSYIIPSEGYSLISAETLSSVVYVLVRVVKN